MTFVPAADQKVFAGIEALPNGAIRSVGGHVGWIFYGPHMAVEAGVYAVTARTRAVGDGPRPLYWDVYSGGRIFGSAEFSQGSRLYVHLMDAQDLEFRIMSDGTEFVHEGVELELLLHDREPASAAQLNALYQRLVADKANPEAVMHVVERLAATGDVSAAERLRKAYVAQTAESAGARLNTLFLDLNTPGRSKLSVEADLGLTRDQILAHTAREPLRIINLPPQRETEFRLGDFEELTRRGYRPRFVHMNRLHREYRYPLRAGQTSMKPSMERPLPVLYRGIREADYSFQDAIAHGEGMTAYCPVSGAELKSTHGFCQHIFGAPQNVYRFEGAEVFYIWAGGFSSAKMFIYMPRSGTILPIEETSLRWYPYEEMVREFNADMLLYAREVRAYLNAPTRPAAVLGLNNIGHFFWNDLAGLQHVVQAGLAPKLVEIVKTRTQYYDYEQLFPELPKASAMFDQPLEVFPYFVKRGLTPIRFTDTTVTPELYRRVRRVAAENATAAGRPPADAPRPLLLINLRKHNKVWVDQVEGYANILNAVHEEYGSVSAVLDGTPDCEDLAAELRRLTRPEVPLYDGLHLSLHDTLHYMDQVDAYLCVVGAGLTLLNCFTDKKGVTHAEWGHLEHLEWWPGMRPDAPQAVAPPKEAVTELGSGWWCNYKVDWRVLLDLLRPILDERFQRKQTAA